MSSLSQMFLTVRLYFIFLVTVDQIEIIYIGAIFSMINFSLMIVVNGNTLKSICIVVNGDTLKSVCTY